MRNEFWIRRILHRIQSSNDTNSARNLRSNAFLASMNFHHFGNEIYLVILDKIDCAGDTKRLWIHDIKIITETFAREWQRCVVSFNVTARINRQRQQQIRWHQRHTKNPSTVLVSLYDALLRCCSRTELVTFGLLFVYTADKCVVVVVAVHWLRVALWIFRYKYGSFATIDCVVRLMMRHMYLSASNFVCIADDDNNNTTMTTTTMSTEGSEKKTNQKNCTIARVRVRYAEETLSLLSLFQKHIVQMQNTQRRCKSLCVHVLQRLLLLAHSEGRTKHNKIHYTSIVVVVIPCCCVQNNRFHSHQRIWYKINHWNLHSFFGWI